jgi:hypothetical protein
MARLLARLLTVVGSGVLFMLLVFLLLLWLIDPEFALARNGLWLARELTHQLAVFLGWLAGLLQDLRR